MLQVTTLFCFSIVIFWFNGVVVSVFKTHVCNHSCHLFLSIKFWFLSLFNFGQCCWFRLIIYNWLVDRHFSQSSYLPHVSLKWCKHAYRVNKILQEIGACTKHYCCLSFEVCGVNYSNELSDVSAHSVN